MNFIFRIFSPFIYLHFKVIANKFFIKIVSVQIFIFKGLLNDLYYFRIVFNKFIFFLKINCFIYFKVYKDLLLQ